MKSKTYTFPRSHRLQHALQFRAVYDAKTREARGSLVIFAAPNNLPHPRLGLSIGRPVGAAVKRNRIKRLLREAFRLMQHDLPVGYDIVINVRPHETALLADYQRMLSGAMVKLHNKWKSKLQDEELKAQQNN